MQASAQIMKDAEKYYTNVAENVTVGILAIFEKIQKNSRVRFTECVEKAVQIKDELYKIKAWGFNAGSKKGPGIYCSVDANWVWVYHGIDS